MENRTIVTALKAGAAHLAGFGGNREGAHKNVLQVRARIKTFHSLCCFSVNEQTVQEGPARLGAGSFSSL